MLTERDRQMAEKFLRTGSANMVEDLARLLEDARLEGAKEERAAVTSEMLKRYKAHRHDPDYKTALWDMLEWLKARAGE